MHFRWIEGEGPGFEDARALRQRVFVEEQGFSAENEFDATDARALHIVGYEDGRPVCTGRLYFEDEAAGAKAAAPKTAHLGRLVVDDACRGRGHGLALLAAMTEKARALGAAAAVLNAQADKTAFYQRAGFACTGGENEDEGVPHVWMRMEW